MALQKKDVLYSYIVILEIGFQILLKKEEMFHANEEKRRRLFGINEKIIKILPVLCAISIIYMLSFSQKMKTNAFLIIFVIENEIKINK